MNIKRFFLLLLFASSFASSIVVAESSIVDLSHTEFSDKLNTNADSVIIDVRSPAEFASGHVPNAINIPHDTILGDASVLDLYQGKDMIFYCRSGKRAGAVTRALQSSNYTDGAAIYHLDGDILGWISAKKPLEK